MCTYGGAPNRFPAKAAKEFVAALSSYDLTYDETFFEIHDRIARCGSAGKLDVAGLGAWKRSAQNKWLKPLMETPEAAVRSITTAAFASGLTDRQRVAQLRQLAGARTGDFAIGSAVLTAWDPDDYGVTDVHARQALHDLFDNCTCDLKDYDGAYLPAARALRDVLNGCGSAGTGWTARKVDMALFKMDGVGDEPRTTPMGVLRSPTAAKKG